MNTRHHTTLAGLLLAATVAGASACYSGYDAFDTSLGGGAAETDERKADDHEHSHERFLKDCMLGLRRLDPPRSCLFP